MKKSIFTQAAHSGENFHHGDFIPCSIPVYNTSTYYYKSTADLERVFSGEKEGYVYSRHGNPTTTALQNALATLEGGDCAFTFSSGMAAIHAALMATGVKSGDHILAARDLYGTTHSLLTTIFSALDINPHFIDIFSMEAVESALETYHPRTFIFEVMSNPLLKIAHVPDLVTCAHEHGTRVVIDSTFTTPFLIQPLRHGTDLVMHSTTKFLNGHGDAVGGTVISNKKFQDPLHQLTILLGAILGPNEAYLTLRGLKTLPLRMQKQCENALQVARYLQDHPRVTTVNYPGLPSHPQHDLATQFLLPPWVMCAVLSCTLPILHTGLSPRKNDRLRESLIAWCDYRWVLKTHQISLQTLIRLSSPCKIKKCNSRKREKKRHLVVSLPIPDSRVLMQKGI